MTGPLLALGASVSWGVGDFLAGLRSRRLPLLTVLVVSQAAGLLSIGLVVAGVALASRAPAEPGRRTAFVDGAVLAVVAAASFGLLLVGLGRRARATRSGARSPCARRPSGCSP